MWKYSGNISPAHVDLQMIALGFFAGIVDAVVYASFAIFVSNQTGNLILLALGVARPHQLVVPINIAHTLCSLGSFCIGAFASGQMGHRLGCCRREWVLFTSLVQSALVMVSAVTIYTIPAAVDNYWNLFIIVALSLTSGAQVALARGLQVPEIPTSMATAAVVDILSDTKLWKKENIPRNRRAYFVVALFLGGLTGSYVLRASDPGPTLLFAGLCKLIISLSFLLNPSAETKETKCKPKV